MNRRYLRILPALTLAAVLAACGGAAQTAAPAAAPTAETMAGDAMASTPTEEAMAGDAMASTPTEEAMADDVMASTPTEEAMADDVMANTPTEEAMAGDAMANTPTEEAMAGDAMANTPTEEAMADDAMANTPTEEAMADHEAMAEQPLWQTLPIVDARSGESFTLGDFAGRTVFVEPMATWCSSCRQQLTNVRGAREQLGDEAVFIALSVETNISSADLARYADEQGFGWTFAVMTPELLAELTASFGRSITNPPATPHFIIRPDGSATELSTGIDSSDEIVGQVRAAAGS